MTTRLQADEVRDLATDIFRQHGARVRRPSDVVESALFDNGKCVAWSYRAAGLMAMWFVEVGILQFYDAEGNMLQTVGLVEPTQSRRMAA